MYFRWFFRSASYFSCSDFGFKATVTAFLGIHVCTSIGPESWVQSINLQCWLLILNVSSYPYLLEIVCLVRTQNTLSDSLVPISISILPIYPGLSLWSWQQPTKQSSLIIWISFWRMDLSSSLMRKVCTKIYSVKHILIYPVFSPVKGVVLKVYHGE